MESHLSTAAAFVEGGIQDAFDDDTCSICLDSFSHDNPSTMTYCKHEYHLQCILEWCQRSSQCPMCWQAIAMKDPVSQDLLDAVERERSIHNNQQRNATFFHLPVGENGNSEFEEHIMQQLAYIARRERMRNRTSAYVSPQYPDTSNPTSSAASERSEARSADVSQFSRISKSCQEEAGPSDISSFSDSLMTRLSTVSIRDTITKTTSGWRARFFNHTSSFSETMSRLLERVQTNNNAAASASAAYVNQDHVVEESKNETVNEDRGNRVTDTGNTSSSSEACSGPN